MNKLPLVGISTFLVSLGTVLATNFVQAATLTEVGPEALLGTSQVFKVESRAGSRGGTSVALSGDGTQGVNPLSWVIDWENGKQYPFEVMYDPLGGTVEMNFNGDSKTSYDLDMDQNFSVDYLNVFAQAKTDNRVAEGTSITLDLTSVNDMSIDPSIEVGATKPEFGDDTVNAYFSSSEGITKLNGLLTLDWPIDPEGNDQYNPRKNAVGSRVQLHITGYGNSFVVSPIESVPEPSSLLGLLTIASLGTFSVLKGKKNS